MFNLPFGTQRAYLVRVQDSKCRHNTHTWLTKYKTNSYLAVLLVNLVSLIFILFWRLV